MITVRLKMINRQHRAIISHPIVIRLSVSVTTPEKMIRPVIRT